jgi:CubicO group peptidase (beta-lactamase class C family)
MKNKIFLMLISILFINASYAQTEKPQNRAVSQTFVENYNKDNFAAIFAMFDTSMQAALPLDTASEFLTGLKSQVGEINKYEFVNYQNGTTATYKTEFDKAILSLKISINADSKINGLLVQPYVDESSLTKAVNNLSTKNKDVTNIAKAQTDIIFENTHLFPNQTQLAIAMIKNGEVNFYGIHRNKDSLESLDNSKSVFEIGSISKVFTSTLLADFMEDKKLKLDDTIDTYLGFELNNQAKITFKQLANHTSGLPRMPTNLDLSKADPSNPYKNYTSSQLDTYLQQELITKQSPGVKNEYSNLGTGLLGYILSKYSNTTYNKLLQQYIFSRYKMNQSTLIREDIKQNLVLGLDNDGNPTSNWDLSVLEGAGGILSSVEDLSKFALAQFDEANKELELTRQKTFEINDVMDIGLGWHILKAKSKHLWYWHNGGTGGYSSSMVFEPNHKNAIIILSNVSAFNAHMANIDKLCFELMKTLELD